MDSSSASSSPHPHPPMRVENRVSFAIIAVLIMEDKTMIC